MKEDKKGFILGTLAFSIWGLLPVYFKAIHFFSPLEMTAHRVIWSFVTLFFYLVFQVRFLETAREILFGGHFFNLLFSTLLIATNWYLFVYAIEQNQILQTSFGYFISPLLSIFLGLFILNEKITSAKIVALILSIFAVGIQAFSMQGFPWISIVLAITFSLYGLMKKKNQIGSVEGITFETFLMFIPSFVILFRLESTNQGHYLQASSMDHLLLFLSGFMTITPLILFSSAVKRLPISTIGFIQYIAPLLQFMTATLIYKETLDTGRMISFSMIILACFIVALDGLNKMKKNKKESLP